ncbi:hypothetical protein KL86CLO1_11442 [uncultured Eubacteriales bacterium]|uniref:Uncharacterized protein n=1 Tax=uncultured Eubacteriales bacterium TaxID=172733 RepID=A0A212JP05_9FIRM|nr:hypothetical protein KL86CLO1_11442 [uncultured Eubacteriales bacterium]
MLRISQSSCGEKKKLVLIFIKMSFFFGGDKRDRTADLLNAIQALSQLSYTPTSQYSVFCGGDKRDRTADLLNAIQALSQLSYTPTSGSARLLPRTERMLF